MHSDQFIFDVRDTTNQGELEYAAATYEEIAACAEWPADAVEGEILTGYPAAACLASWWMINAWYED
jgi:hypothetical protein